MSSFLKAFEKQKYLNLETFRKSGEGVKTPVWFAQDGNMLRVWTPASSGKVKRIRQNGKVRIVPCSASGVPAGTWLEAVSVVFDTPAELEMTQTLFKQKYGLSFRLIALLGRLGKRQNVTIQVRVG